MTSPSLDPVGGFFGELSAEDRDAIRSRASRRSFAAGSTLMYEGQVGTEVLVLLAGRVKVTYLTSDGREVILDFRGPGDLLGEMAVVDREPRSNTVRAIEPVDALVMSAADFRAVVAESRTFADVMLQNVIRRFRDSDRKLVEFGASRTAGRVAHRLVEMVERFGVRGASGHVIDLPISQEELAGWTGSSLEAVAKALHALRAAGLVSTDRRRFTVLDLDGLRNRAR